MSADYREPLVRAAPRRGCRRGRRRAAGGRGTVRPQPQPAGPAAAIPDLGVLAGAVALLALGWALSASVVAVVAAYLVLQLCWNRAAGPDAARSPTSSIPPSGPKRRSRAGSTSRPSSEPWWARCRSPSCSVGWTRGR